MESLISVLKFQTENNMRDILTLSRIGLLASGVQSNLSYQSFFFNGSWLTNRYSPAPPSLSTCSCGVAFICSAIRALFLCTTGNNCTAGTAVWGIPGFVKGCISIDNTYLSDFQCFYNQTCLDTVRSMYNVDIPDRLPLPTATLSIPPLDVSVPSRFSPSDPLSKILDQLMVEEWEIQFNFESYYERCAPQSCTYTKVQRLNVIGVFTTLVGLTGGASVILKLLISIFGRGIEFFIFYWASRRSHIAQSQFTTESSKKTSTDDE